MDVSGPIRLLVVEDDPLIGWDVCDQLTTAGFDLVGLATSARAGLALLEEHGCDAAILDVNLGNHTSADVAEALLAASIPFVTVTGYSTKQIAPVFVTGPVLGKPLDFGRLVSAVQAITRPM